MAKRPRGPTHADLHRQRQSATLLLVGALSSLCGMVSSTAIGSYLYNFSSLKKNVNFRGEPFASGHNYTPLNFSEMVSGSHTAHGQAFFAFSLVASICLLVSWYPKELANVYTDQYICRALGLTWIDVRQFFPPIGMLLVICMQVPRPIDRDFVDMIVINMHRAGAVSMIAGYALSEFHLLSLAILPRGSEVHFEPGEWGQRAFWVVLCMLNGVAFFACSQLEYVSRDWGCGDVWRVPTTEDLQHMTTTAANADLVSAAAHSMRAKRVMIVNTAYGSCAVVKASVFWSEVLCGASMVFSLLTIWYYCPERHVDLEALQEHPMLSEGGSAPSNIEQGAAYGATAAAGASQPPKSK